MISWILKELLYYKKYVFLLVLNLVLGILGFLIIDSFRFSMEDRLSSQSKQFLSADVSISTRRRFTEEEQKTVQSLAQENQWQVGRVSEFFSMITHQGSSRLVQIKAIESTYPFYGSLMLSDNKKIEGGNSFICDSDQAWIYPELMSQLSLKSGDEINLGTKKIKITNTVEQDSTQTFRMASLAPKVYVCLDKIKDSGLIQQGSTITEIFLIKTPEEQTMTGVLETLKSKFPDAAVRIETSQDAADDSVRSLKYLTDYLGLVSLVALFLSCLGVAFVLRSFMRQKLKGIAIAHAVGIQKNTLLKWYFIELVVIGFIGFISSLLLSYFIVPIVSDIVKSFTPVDIAISLNAESFLVTFVISFIPILLIGYPFAEIIKKSSTLEIFQERISESFKIKEGKYILFVLFCLALFWGLAFWTSKSVFVTTVFVATFFVAIMLIMLVGFLSMKALSLVHFKNWVLKHGVLSLVRMKGATLLAFTCLAGGSLLMNLIPQLKTGLQSEIRSPKNQKLPSLFLFDIQEDQVGELESFLKGQNIEPLLVSPMVRARILKVNDQDYERAERSEGVMTREEENEMRMRNRGVNLSYRSELSYSEEVVRGEYFKKTFDPNSQKLPELSIEERYAGRMGIDIGDKILFDIQGVEMKAEITSIRKIRWNTFLPNFFIQFQPGVLEDAPKTFIAALAQLSSGLVDTLQSEIVKRFPNVSIIDVKRLVESILDITAKMSVALQSMAALSLFVGFLIMGSILQTQIVTRKKVANLFKILGAKQKSLFGVFVFEFFLLSLMASFIGSLLSLSVSFGLSYFLFESLFEIDWPTLVLTFIGINLLSLVISSIFIMMIVREKPITLIQEPA